MNNNLSKLKKAIIKEIPELGIKVVKEDEA